jgi:hypothetical protein
MVQETSVSDLPGRLPTVIAASALAVCGLALAAAVGLWLHYGTAVFFQMVASGLAACF